MFINWVKQCTLKKKKIQIVSQCLGIITCSLYYVTWNGKIFFFQNSKQIAIIMQKLVLHYYKENERQTLRINSRKKDYHVALGIQFVSLMIKTYTFWVMLSKYSLKVKKVCLNNNTRMVKMTYGVLKITYCTEGIRREEHLCTHILFWFCFHSNFWLQKLIQWAT